MEKKRPETIRERIFSNSRGSSVSRRIGRFLQGANKLPFWWAISRYNFGTLCGFYEKKANSGIVQSFQGRNIRSEILLTIRATYRIDSKICRSRIENVELLRYRRTSKFKPFIFSVLMPERHSNFYHKFRLYDRKGDGSLRRRSKRYELNIR